ncbi:hypothetical protein [Pedobacter sp. Leaf132]|nr:hypothetical protein [Pedobacter sp. Leaf132]
MVEELILSKHRDISEIQLEEICKLKAIRWNYPLEEHKSWMQKNIEANDYHLLVSKDQQLVAYSNLINTFASINGELTVFKGIGNVCTRESGQGYGNILMDSINISLFEHNWKGILLCKDHLIAYYQKFGWSLVKKKEILSPIADGINYMIYNHKLKVNSFEYSGRNF